MFNLSLKVTLLTLAFLLINGSLLTMASNSRSALGLTLGYTIRPASAEDIPSVLWMIQVGACIIIFMIDTFHL